MKYLLDSVILIDHLNGRAAATEFLSKARHAAAISVLTRAEVLVPYEEKQAIPIARLLDVFPALAIDAAVADRAAALQREHGWKLADALQAALAYEHELKLITRNTADFPPDRYSFVMVPY